MYCSIQKLTNKLNIGYPNKYEIIEGLDENGNIVYEYGILNYFPRYPNNSYKIVIKESKRKNGKNTHTLQKVICTMSENDIMNNEFDRIWNANKDDLCKDLDINQRVIYSLIMEKYVPLRHEILYNFQLTKESRVHENNIKMLNNYNAARYEFNAKYKDVPTNIKFENIYDLHLEIRNVELLKCLKILKLAYTKYKQHYIK